jgi:hypothetical protein
VTSPFVLVSCAAWREKPVFFQMHGALVMQRENSGGGADTGSSKRIDDAGHNLFSSGEATIGGTPPAQREVVIVVSGSQATADQSSACDDERHIAIASRAERPDIAVRKRLRPGRKAGLPRAKRAGKPPSIGVTKSLYSAGL